jgi:uncharacterized membrane protein
MGVFSWIRESLRTSLWFIPALLVLGAILLAAALIAVDVLVGNEFFRDWQLLFGAGADGSREVLSAIAGSMVTVAGVTFSITIVALSLTASQYSSRVLRNFMRDRTNQTVLGVFVAVFVYCLVVLRVIRGGDENLFVPELSVLVGVLLALVAIAFLVFFIHHVATSIQAVSIIASAAHETRIAIDRLFPEQLGEEADDDDVPHDVPMPSGAAWHDIPAQHTGYLQGVDSDALMSFAESRQTTIRMERGIGEFVVEGTPLVSLVAVCPPDEEAIRDLNEAYVVNVQRSVYQDPSFGIQQLVDIALKALSPGVNDTTTAVISIDHLSAILARAATRRRVSDYRYKDGKLRVIAHSTSFRTLVFDSFEQIRRSAAGNVAALVRMFNAVVSIALVTQNSNRREVLREYVHLVWETANRSIDFPHERRLLEERRDGVLRVLDVGVAEKLAAAASVGPRE